ncbi:MAG: MmgE/PrpD family protein [Thermomicrobiales bacterium]|nr:MmgE/PrpD family protein [Thermomicrobiales bacterium]
MPQPAPTTRILTEFVANARFRDLPPAVVADAKRAVLDWVGSALAGALEPPARMARTVVAGFGAGDEATLFPAERASAAGAALGNGIAAHILEFDDVHKGATLHAAAPIIPAALAVAEREGADGAAFLLAVVLGYEAALRIGEAVNPSHYRYWHPTGTAATFGAAAAAGSLLRLDERQMLDAFGTAGTTAAGLWEFNADGAMSKHLHPGMAAFHGVLAVDLARRGFTGATRILEGARGFFRAMSECHDADRITDRLGTTWKISENCYKLHSCCGHTHTAIDAALALREEMDLGNRSVAREIAAIEIATYDPGYAIVREANPRTPFQAKFSLAYCAAAALADGAVGLAQFAPERFAPEGTTEPTIAALLSRVRVAVDPDLTARYPAAWPARVAVTLKDGREYATGFDYPRGNPEAPVTTEELEAKAHALIAPGYGAPFATRVLAAMRVLDATPDMALFARETFSREVD